MAQPSLADIASRVRVMLTGANLDLVTAKTVRRELEEHFKVDLSVRKKEIGAIINQVINSEVLNGSSSHDKVDNDADKQPVKRVKTVAERKEESREQSSEDDEDIARRLQQEEETSGKRATRSGRQTAAGQKRKKKAKSKEKATDSSDSRASDSESDADGNDKKKVKKTTKGGYLKAIPLSHELSTFLGADEMPRHEVVKRIWSYCKENNLLDPKNRQFSICNDELRKVFGVKRFRMFGMMKLLGKHFHSNSR